MDQFQVYYHPYSFISVCSVQALLQIQSGPLMWFSSRTQLSCFLGLGTGTLTGSRAIELQRLANDSGGIEACFPTREGLVTCESAAASICPRTAYGGFLSVLSPTPNTQHQHQP
jgi:hypothetical protein